MALQAILNRDANVGMSYNNYNRFGFAFRCRQQFRLKKGSATRKRKKSFYQSSLSVGGVLHFREKNIMNIVANLGCLFIQSQSHGTHCLDHSSLRRINHRNAKSSLNISAITSHSCAAQDQNVGPIFSY